MYWILCVRHGDASFATLSPSPCSLLVFTGRGAGDSIRNICFQNPETGSHMRRAVNGMPFPLITLIFGVITTRYLSPNGHAKPACHLLAGWTAPSCGVVQVQARHHPRLKLRGAFTWDLRA